MDCEFVIKFAFIHCGIYRLIIGQEMDVRSLNFEAGTFDVAIDKGWVFNLLMLLFTHWIEYIVYRNDGRHDDIQG